MTEVTSATVDTNVPMQNVTRVTFPCAKIQWPEFDCEYGHMLAREYDIDPTITGRVDIWKCSVSDANPEGYFVSVANADNSYIGCEPGDLSNDKHLLCKIILRGAPSVNMDCRDDDLARNGGRSYLVEYWNPRLPVKPDPKLLCPDPIKVPADYNNPEPLVIGQEPPTATPLAATSAPKATNAFAAEAAKQQSLY